jgi:hypothetical protein
MAPITDLATVTQLRHLGRLWQENDMRRVYFSDLPARLGLQCCYYKTGNISSASLYGQAISNYQAKKMVDRLSGKLWFDENDGQFHAQGLSPEDTKAIINTILAQVVHTGATTMTLDTLIQMALDHAPALTLFEAYEQVRQQAQNAHGQVLDVRTNAVFDALTPAMMGCKIDADTRALLESLRRSTIGA